VFIYSAICAVPEETLVTVTAWLLTHRRRIRTRLGRRAGTVRNQAELVLRWFRDDAPLRQLATEAGIGISTAYRYLHEGFDVLAEQAPDLHDVTVDTRLRGALAFRWKQLPHARTRGPHVLLVAENGRSGRASGSTVIKSTVATTTRDGAHASTTLNTRIVF